MLPEKEFPQIFVTKIFAFKMGKSFHTWTSGCQFVYWVLFLFLPFWLTTSLIIFGVVEYALRYKRSQVSLSLVKLIE
jgi:hypothetical protein